MDWIDISAFLTKYPALLDIIVSDHSSGKTLVWGTNNYSNYGNGFSEKDHIFTMHLTGYNKKIIKPRVHKSQRDQKRRSRDVAEVFTASWICNKQNNVVDEGWFGRKYVFNVENEDNTWTVTDKVLFNDKPWQDYIKETVLEATCGEAPYLVSRYDTTSGEYIDVKHRIGLLDRKLRVINENVDDKDEWKTWAKIAYQSTYGYDFQGDNIILARENLLFDYIDNYLYKFNEEPSLEDITEIAKIISWNIFQMDGLKYVIPLSCHNEKMEYLQMSLNLFEDESEPNLEVKEEECPGCVKDDNTKHNGIYVKVKDWEKNKTIRFIDLLKFF